jgi:hypothetical protein
VEGFGTCSAVGCGDEPRRVLRELSAIQSVDVIPSPLQKAADHVFLKRK